MRELLALYDNFVGGNESNTFKRVENAIKFANDLLAAKPAYALRVPELNARLEQLKKHNHDYLAHEYLNRDWICMYFSEVADILSAAKLDYACTAELIETFDQFNLTADAQKFLNALSNPIVREQARDYFVNRQFRKDIYVRGLRRLSQVERQMRLLDTRFVLTTVEPLPTSFASGVGGITFPAAALNIIAEHLAKENYRPKTFRDIVRGGRLPLQFLEQTLALLVQNGQVLPCQPEEIVEQVKPKCDALNAHLCRRAETSTEIMFLASPVTGMGMTVGRIEQIFASLVKRGLDTAEELARGAWTTLDGHGERMIRDGKMLQSAEENIAELSTIARRFVDKQLPILRALQIV